MSIEFTTSINDYKFSDLSDKMTAAFKEHMLTTVFYEKINVLRQVKALDLPENQTSWFLI